MKSYTQRNTIPEVGVEVRIESNIIRVFFDFKRITVEREEGGKKVKEEQVEMECVDVYNGRDYGTIVSAIINDRYTNDDVQAILANYAEANDTASELPAEKKEEYLQEYNEFQTWRHKAKEVAKTTLTLI